MNQKCNKHIEDIPGIPGYKSLTPSQVKSINLLCAGEPDMFYRECRLITTTLVRLETHHDLSRDKWARRMYEHYSYVLRSMDMYYQIIMSVPDRKPAKCKGPNNGQSTKVRHGRKLR